MLRQPAGPTSIRGHYDATCGLKEAWPPWSKRGDGNVITTTSLEMSGKDRKSPETSGNLAFPNFPEFFRTFPKTPEISRRFPSTPGVRWFPNQVPTRRVGNNRARHVRGAVSVRAGQRVTDKCAPKEFARKIREMSGDHGVIRPSVPVRNN